MKNRESDIKHSVPTFTGESGLQIPSDECVVQGGQRVLQLLRKDIDRPRIHQYDDMAGHLQGREFAHLQEGRHVCN